MAENTAIARPYAQAAFDLAREAGQLDVWSAALRAAAAVVIDARVAALIGGPTTDADKLIKLITEIAGGVAAGVPAREFGNLIHLLSDNRRLTALPDIASRL